MVVKLINFIILMNFLLLTSCGNSSEDKFTYEDLLQMPSPVGNQDLDINKEDEKAIVEGINKPLQYTGEISQLDSRDFFLIQIVHDPTQCECSLCMYANQAW